VKSIASFVLLAAAANIVAASDLNLSPAGGSFQVKRMRNRFFRVGPLVFSVLLPIYMVHCRRLPGFYHLRARFARIYAQRVLGDLGLAHPQEV
jgi:hypothetical protein